MATVGGTLGAGFVLDPDAPATCCGPSIGVSGSIGLGDTYALRAHVDAAWHPSSDAEPNLWIGFLGLEAIYLLDIVSVVPFFGIGLDAVLTGGDIAAGLEFGAHAILGADYLLSRDLAIGIDIRPKILFLSAVEDGRLDPVYLTVALRISHRFDL